MRNLAAASIAAACLLLAACATPPAGSPPPSPREQALQVDQDYSLVLTAVNSAMDVPAIPATAKKQIAAASGTATAAVLAYSHQADNCFRDPGTNVVGNAPGKVCDQNTVSNALSVAWAALGQVNGLLTAFAPSLAVKLPSSTASP